MWVGFPGDAPGLDERDVLHGANIDGGTYPAQIWGEYMKKAHGKYCGDFKQPTEPFQSQPFFGHYSKIGQKGRGEEGSGGGRRGRGPVAGRRGQAEIDKPGTDDNGTTPGGTEEPPFDPNQYETPPQGDPNTGTPGGAQGPRGDG